MTIRKKPISPQRMGRATQKNKSKIMSWSCSIYTRNIIHMRQFFSILNIHSLNTHNFVCIFFYWFDSQYNRLILLVLCLLLLAFAIFVYILHPEIDFLLSVDFGGIFFSFRFRFSDLSHLSTVLCVRCGMYACLVYSYYKTKTFKISKKNPMLNIRTSNSK